MSCIEGVFSRPGQRSVILYLTVGYPSIEATLEIVPLLVNSGCDIIELGIPFSDPLADGVTIQKASFNALKNGITPQVCLDVAKELRKKIGVPLVFMTYYNPILSFGLEKFCSGCATSGVDGLIVPDLPPEEGIELEGLTQNLGLDLIYLLSPTSTEERIRLVAEKSRGFIYLVSVTGVTGARNTLSKDLEAFVTRVRRVTNKPLCVGFGISTPEQAGQVARLADGVIIGSRLIQLMESCNILAVSNFVKEVRTAIDNG